MSRLDTSVRRRLKRIALAGVLLVSSPVFGAPPNYKLETILDAYSPASGLSQNGRVVGHSIVLSNPDTGASVPGYIWSASTGLKPIPSSNFPSRDGILRFSPSVVRVNSGGLVGGTAILDGVALPAVWSASSGLIVLGGFDGNLLQPGAVFAVNDKNQAVGFAFGGGYNGFGPFIWDSVAGLRRLAGFNGGNGIAHDINELGQVVGECGSCTVANSFDAFVWNPDTGVTVIPKLDSTGRAFGFAINDNGRVVGYESTASGHTIFTWSPTEGIVNLGNPFPGSAPYYLDINNAGDIVATMNGATSPYLYTQGSWWRLQDLVDGPDGTVSTAAQINNAGQIVGEGTINGYPGRGYILTPKIATELTLATATVAGCRSTSARVSILKPAPAGGLTFTLSDSLLSATVPASVTIPEGATSRSFTIRTTQVVNEESGEITVSRAGLSRTKPLTVRPVGVLSTTLSPTTVAGSQSVVGTVKLECKAGLGPIPVELASSKPDLANPIAPNLVIPQGVQSATFEVGTNAVLARTTSTISATANGVTKGRTLTVTPAAVASPTSVRFGSVAVGSTSLPSSVTLTNRGAAPIAVLGISVTGTAASWFAQVNDCPANLAAGASCTINVTFKPISAASKSARLSIATSATATPLSVSLSGTGVLPP